jgi:excisionase family DNA binding protein
MTAIHLDLLKPADVARRLGVSRSWLYEAAKHGRVPCVRLGALTVRCA